MLSRRALMAALLLLTACSSGTDPEDSASSIDLSETTVSFDRLLATHQLTATVRDQSGATVSGVSVTWSTLSSAVAQISPTGALTVQVTAVGNGSTQVIASVGGVQAQATVNVNQVPAAIDVTPDTLELFGPTATGSVTASVTDAGGSPIASPAITWTSLNEGVATVNAAGLVTGVATGRTTVTASASGGGSVTGSATVDVGGLTTIVTTSLPAGRVGTAYSASLGAVGGTGSYTWSLLSGSLPSGLQLSTSGIISGTPTAVGSSSFTVRVMSGLETDTQALTLVIDPSVILETSYLVGGYPGGDYSDQIEPATGGNGTFTYAVTDGALPTGLSLNASTGVISGPSTVPGVYFFEISATSGPEVASATYAITISTVPSSEFNLWLSFAGGAIPPTNTVTALENALARWEEIVLGEVSNETYPPTGLTPGFCSLIDASMLNGAFIDDVSIVMAIAPFDGPGKTLARGGPCGWGRQTLPAVITGQMSLDAADVPSASAAFMELVVWHEIAHVMGIGTLWQGSLSGAGTATPRYVGTNGSAQWTQLGGAVGGAYVEPSIEAHWHEAWFDSEIMTPTTEGSMGAMPISRVTIGALIDLGWTADVNAADPYALPGCQGSCSLSAPEEGEPFDIVVVEPLVPLPE